MNKVINAVKDAERQGFVKFKSENNTDMVIVTQAELDAVIKQREEMAVRAYCENME